MREFYDVVTVRNETGYETRVLRGEDRITGNIEGSLKKTIEEIALQQRTIMASDPMVLRLSETIHYKVPD
jgi:hypothetical protein